MTSLLGATTMTGVVATGMSPRGTARTTGVAGVGATTTATVEAGAGTMVVGTGEF